MHFQSLIVGEIPYLAVITPLTFHMPLHWHHEIEVLYCLSGGFIARAYDSVYEVRQGQAVFINSAEPHEFYSPLPNTKVLLIEIGTMLLNRNFQDLAMHSFRKSVFDIDMPGEEPCDSIKKVHELFSTIIKELEREDDTCSEWSIRGCLYSLSSIMRRDLQSNKKALPKQGTIMKAMVNMSQVINYVQEHYYENITLEEMAKLSGYEKSNFCKQFKRATNLSFHKYLNMFRINMACCLLEDLSATVSSIAEKVGFREVKTFCRVFKECVKMTPGEYRKSIYIDR